MPGIFSFVENCQYFLFSTKRWECGLDGEFVTKEPDRGDCTSPWMDDVGDQVLKTFV